LTGLALAAGDAKALTYQECGSLPNNQLLAAIERGTCRIDIETAAGPDTPIVIDDSDDGGGNRRNGRNGGGNGGNDGGGNDGGGSSGGGSTRGGARTHP
jgi:hypothetical protein